MGEVKVLEYYEGFYPSSGGIEAHIRDLCENLPCEFVVVADLHDESLGRLPELPNTQSIRLGPKNTTTMLVPSPLNLRPLFPYRVAADWLRYRRTARHLQAVECDLAHFHGAGIGTSLMKLLTTTSMYHLLDPLSTATPANVPKIMTIHGLPMGGNEDFREFLRRFLSSFDAFICVDEHLVDAAKRLGAPSSASFEYIPNSVNIHRFRPCDPSLNQPSSKPLRVGFIGRLEASRGLGTLRQLAERLPSGAQLRVALAASSVQLQRFQRYLENPRIDVRLNVPYEAVSDFYLGIDVLLNPVEVPGISRATLEAMACGKPVIMTDLGNRYPVEDGVTGFLFDPGRDDISELVANLVGQRDRLVELGREARQRVEREFSNEAVLPRVWAAYERLTLGA